MTASQPSADLPTPQRGYMLSPEEGVPGRDAEVKCSARSTGASLALYRSVIHGQGPPPHRHRHEDETIVVRDGTLTVTCGEDTWSGATSTTFFLPRGLTHAFWSTDGPATILLVVTPGHLDEFFRLRETLDDPADPARAAELAARFF